MARLRGAVGAALLAEYTGTVVVPIGDRPFHAAVRIVRLADTRVLGVRATPHRAGRPGRSRSGEGLVVAILTAGRRSGHYQGSSFIDVPGSIALRRRRAVTTWRCPEPTAALEFEIPLTALPASTSLGPLRGRSLVPSAVTTVVIALVRSAIESPPLPGSAASAAIETALLGLVAALVAQQGHPHRSRHDIFATAVAAIESDPSVSLREAELAVAVGVDRAELREAFAEQGTTPTRLLRAVRLATLTDLLQHTDRSVPLHGLSDRAGYGDADQARRALRTRFGVSVREYRALFGPASGRSSNGAPTAE
ncbi:helix-turn-helix transcriptional regulator [Microbacteriaceae bacterium VKM Ac-2854]|nr:helix-turn-helix transcriptional regulator [Microbacteriaceae bacterium VKM Ac-2854]